MTSDTNTQEQRYQSQRSSETEIELLWERLKQVEGKVGKMEEDKSKALLWGVRTLGMLLMGLAGYLWQILSGGKH